MIGVTLYHIQHKDKNILFTLAKVTLSTYRFIYSIPRSSHAEKVSEIRYDGQCGASS